MRRAGAALVSAAALALTACPVGDRQGDPPLAASDPGYDRALQVRYLGVATHRTPAE